MQPKTFVTGRYKYGLILLLAVILGGGGYWFFHDWGQASAAASPHSTSDGAETEKDSSEGPEVVDFPSDMWDTVGLRTEPVKKAEMQQAIELTGKIALNEDKLSHIFPLVEGRVDEVKVRFGDRVKKGDLLVVVQSREVGQAMLQLFQDRMKLEFAKYKLQWTEKVGENTQVMIEMMRSRDSIQEIEAALKDRTMGDYREKLMTAYVDYLKAQAHMDRLSSLSDSGVVAARQMVEVESTLNATQATLQALLEQIAKDTIQASRLAGQAVRELETSTAVAATNLKILGFNDNDLADIDPAMKGEQLAHYPVTAPFDGTVISKDVVLLERVGPERQILSIADLSTVWVNADIYESHLPLLSKLHDETIYVRSDSWPGQRFEAKIFYTGDLVQESTRTIALRAVASNAEGRLKPGMFVTIELPSLTTGEVLQVPLPAIQNHEGKTFVFVQTGDDSFTRRNVTLGHRSDDAIEIRSGLKEGDRVVVEGSFALKSKMLSDLLAE